MVYANISGTPGVNSAISGRSFVSEELVTYVGFSAEQVESGLPGSMWPTPCPAILA
ncbi:MAG: hypothetical protein HKN05_12070 [Rhizobiales bacterium]|nr:hypothetical protein [Hyphomicrobiales bacterium]